MLRALAVMVIWVMPICADVAHASLGGDVVSVVADSDLVGGMVRTTSFALYDVQQIDAPNDLRVREFVRRDGIVFGVTWSGPLPPDLSQWLGASFDAYAAALAAIHHPGLHRSVRVALTELVVESGGHLRAYSGRAYLPALIPAGASIRDIR